MITKTKENTVVLSEDGSWCWFQDERVIIDGDILLFTGVTSDGANTVSSYNMRTNERESFKVNDKTFQADDHNVGVLLVRTDRRYLTVYTGHGVEQKMRYRISTNPGDISAWETEKVVDTRAHATYSNVYRLSQTGRIYNFYRGINLNPNYMISYNEGDTWRYGGQLLSYPGRPYVRYASNGINRIHFITTERHPRYFDNGIYHGYVEYDYLFSSDGTPVGRISTGRQSDFIPQHFTRIFRGDSENVAWTSDIELDQKGYPYVAFSVTKDPRNRGGKTSLEETGFDHRYHYARWDSNQWQQHEIAFAGTCLYTKENEYTGNIALHPNNPDEVYISTNVDPVSGEPLMTSGVQRYEIFQGTTSDRGATWEWTAITENSEGDNIRPIVASDENYEAVLWLNGRYTTYKDYNLKVLGLIKERDN